MLSYPYLLFADALILATMAGTWLVLREHHWRGYALAIGAAACLSVSHAYDLITVYSVLSAYGLVEWIRTREFPRRLASVGIPIAAVSGPAALYYQQLTSGDPLWRSILSQYSNAGVWTPPHYHLIILMGVPLLLAVAAFRSPQPWPEERRFVAVWSVVSLGLIYLPVVYQIKMLSAWQFPVAVLAAHAWHERAVPALPRMVPPRWAVAALIGFVSLTNVYLFAWRFTELRRHDAPYYLHQDDVAALAWLAGNTGPDDVVLAPVDIGQFVPNYGESRAYLAHWAMTNRFFERRENVDRFFDPASSDEWRRSLLSSEGVTLVLRSDWGLPDERDFDPGVSGGFEKVFDRPGAQIYRVAGPRHAARASDPPPQ